MSGVRSSYRKSRTIGEKRTTEVQNYLDTASALQGAAWYLALTKLCQPIYQFFMLNQNYFFLVTLFFYLLNMVLYAVNFGLSANKNAGKTANLAYKVFFFLFYLSIIVGAILITPLVGTFLFYASCVIDPLVNTIKAFYFGIKAIMAKSKAEEAFFSDKMMEAVKFVVIGGLFAIAMLSLYSVAGLPLIATAVIGIVFTVAAIVLAPLVKRGIEKIYQLIKGKPEATEDDQLERQNNVEKRHGFYSNSLLQGKLTTAELLQKIQHLRQVLEWKSKPEQKLTIIQKLFSQRPKRHNKISALNLLEDLVNKVPQLADNEQANNVIQLADGKVKIDFIYNNKEELIKKINHHILKHYKDAYQSFFRDKGRVESICEQGFELVRGSP